MLSAVARDQRWSDVVAGISASFSKFAFVLFCYKTNHLMNGPFGNREFCLSSSVDCILQVSNSYYLNQRNLDWF